MCQELKPRYKILDQIRGIAIILMVIFHIAYDLNIYKFVNIDFQQDMFWWTLPRVIVTLFLLAVGMSLALVHDHGIKWKIFFRRYGLIALYALLITISTYFMFPSNWVYFGTLHCIAITGFIALFFLPYPRISLVIALIILILSLCFKINIPFFKMRHQSMDYIPVFPWISIVLIGIFLKFINFHQKVHLFHLDLAFVRFLGRHGLKIYILHQPIIYGLIYFIHLLVKPT